MLMAGPFPAAASPQHGGTGGRRRMHHESPASVSTISRAAPQAEVGARFRRRPDGVEPLPVVDDGQPERLPRGRNPHPHQTGAGVQDHVVQGFLRHPKEDRLGLGRNGRSAGRIDEANSDRGSLVKSEKCCRNAADKPRMSKSGGRSSRPAVLRRRADCTNSRRLLSATPRPPDICPDGRSSSAASRRAVTPSVQEPTS